MNQEQWQSFLGLANRARKVISGEELVIKDVRRNAISLVILSRDASANTAKKVMDKCSYYNVPVKLVEDRFLLGKAIGKDSRVVVGITDAGFAKKMKTLLD
ncbi:YlxQ family RNA-binding protein [Priestia filamentosa]|uniref:YlxQ family RNA-binding protein n=1 Tax=Priestia TaxID=2800373 RepID=UPI001FB2E4FD|nr:MULTISPECIES: YlxQ family RNA-binding protein [Priestia]MCY8231819.1 YlxQ family RNA-binding protein [Priestia endophytica]MED3724963.1 YlxQ family RNA-binding protein [Priestia filamentosa]UOE61767.1 YlxQ family RNA-binding protein [Priestia filamentosa]